MVRNGTQTGEGCTCSPLAVTDHAHKTIGENIRNFPLASTPRLHGQSLQILLSKIAT